MVALDRVENDQDSAHDDIDEQPINEPVISCLKSVPHQTISRQLFLFGK